MKKSTIIFSIIAALLFPINLHSEDPQIDTWYEIIDINYNYRLYQHEDSGKYDCEGELVIAVKVYKDFKHMFLRRTRPYLSDSDPKKMILTIQYDVNDSNEIIYLKSTNVHWGTYFYIEGVYNNNSNPNVKSQMYCVNDLISTDDWDKIRISNGSAGIDGFEEESQFRLTNQTLTIDTKQSTIVYISDLSGTTIFCGSITGHNEIPVATKLIIVKYFMNGKIFTKKLIAS